jgi:hypothetical protein
MVQSNNYFEYDTHIDPSLQWAGKKAPNTSLPTIPLQHKELFDSVSKLNKYNIEVITTVAKSLINLQTKNKSLGKEV